MNKTLAQILHEIEPESSARNHLLVSEFDQTEGVFYLVNQAVAYCFELEPIGVSASSMNDKKMLTEVIAQAIGNLPEKTTITMTSYRSRLIESDVKRYQAHESESGSINPVLKLLRDRHLERIQYGLEHPLLESGSEQFVVRKLVNVCCIIIQPSESVGIIDSLIDVGKELFEYVARPLGYRPGATPDEKEFLGDLAPQQRRFHGTRRALTKTILRAAERVTSALQSCGMNVFSLNREQFGAHVRCLIHPNSGHRDTMRYDDRIELYNQIPTHDLEVDKKKGLVASDKANFRVASLLLSPESVYPGFISRPHRLLKRSVLDYLQDGHITIAATMENTANCRHLANKQLKYGHGDLCPVDRREKVIAESLRMLQHIENGGTMLSTTITAVCYADTEEGAERNITTLCDRMRQIGLPMRVEGSEGPRYFFQSIPLNYQTPIKRAQRDKLITDKVVSALFPVYGFGRGYTGPRTTSMHLNRAGEPVHVNVYAGGASPHSLWTGKTGVGKTFGVIKYITDFLCNKLAQAFIIDPNNSFSNLIGTLGSDGSVNVLGGENRTTINIFRGTLAQQQDVLLTFLSALATPDGIPLSGTLQGKINAVIQRAYVDRQLTNVKFKEFSELFTSKDLFVAHARKRLRAQFVDHETAQGLIALRRRTDGRPPVFDVWFRYYVYEAIIFNDDGEVEYKRAITAVENIPATLREFITEVKKCSIEQLLDEPVTILSTSAELASLFESKGLRVELDTQYTFIDVEQREDADEAQNYGVKFIVPDDICQQLISEELAWLRQQPAYAAAADDTLRIVAVDRVKRPAGSRLYDYLEGTATLQHEVFFSDFGAILNAMADSGDTVADDLKNRLGAYYGRGTQSAYFDGPTGFDLSRRIICFEVSGLFKATEHMQSLVLSAVLQMLNIHGQSPANRSRPKLLAFDEGHRFLSKDITAVTVSVTWRELRKWETECHLITQGVGELQDSKHGQAILAQTSNHFQFKQESDAVERISQALNYTPEQQMVYKTLGFNPGVFSEFMWINKDANICEAIIFMPEPTQYWVATSNGIDAGYRRERMDDLRSQYADATDQEIRMLSISQLAHQYPNGYHKTKR